jgi:ABC-type transport system involved in cytochrome bd biosynthesis fused ATPase/permease subunit
MDKGLISEIGSPQELMEKKGMFYEMVSYTGKGMNSLIKAIFKMSGKN